MKSKVILYSIGENTIKDFDLLNVYVIGIFPFCSMFDNLSISRKYQWTIVWTKMINLTAVTLNNGTYHNGE